LIRIDKLGAVGLENKQGNTMKKAVRKMTMEADWKLIQERTFVRWANENLKDSDKSIDNLEKDFSDGLKLIALVQKLSGKSLGRHNRNPNFRTQKLENVTIVLEFLEKEGVTLVNIDSSDIVDGKKKLLMSLIWALILHYESHLEFEDEEQKSFETGDENIEKKSPKEKLIGWLQRKTPHIDVSNVTSDWQSGIKLGALVDGIAPGLIPDWTDWNSNEPI